MGRIASHTARHTPSPHGGRLASAYTGSNMIDFSSSVTPLGVPPEIARILKDEDAMLEAASEYPDARYRTLSAEVAKYVGLRQDNIIVGNGAAEIIYNAAFLLGRTGRILIPAPTFSEYGHAIRMYYGEKRIKHFETLDMRSTLEAFAKYIPGDGLVFICNPNNPTGSLLTRDEVAFLIDTAASRKSCHVIVDECFIEMTQTGRHDTVMPLVSTYDNLVVLRSLTKSFGIPGLRIGYAAASPRLAGMINNMRLPWSINALAQIVAVAALRHSNAILRRACRLLKKETVYLHEKLSNLQCVITCYETQANFILLRVRYDSGLLQAYLAENSGVLVRDCSDFYGLGSNHIRVAIKKHKNNAALVRALKGVHI